MNNKAVSEIVGTMILIGITFFVFVILYLTVTNQMLSLANDNPHCSVLFWHDEEKIYCEHIGGETIYNWSILVNSNVSALGEKFEIGNIIYSGYNSSMDSFVVLRDKRNLIGTYYLAGNAPAIVYENITDLPFIEEVDNGLGFVGNDSCDSISDVDEKYLYTFNHFGFYCGIFKAQKSSYGSEINNLTIYAICKNTDVVGNGVATGYLTLRFNGSWYRPYQMGVNVWYLNSCNWTLYKEVFEKNPETNQPWNINDINSLDYRICLNAAVNGNKVRCDTFWSEIK